MKPKQQLEELRRLSQAKDLSGYAALLKNLLSEDFKLWFRILREQKLLSQFRDVVQLADLRRLLLQTSTASLSAREAKTLDHHFEVCEFMQNVFAHIDQEVRGSGCCAAHPEIVARAVALLAEVSHEAFQRMYRVSPKSLPHTIPMSQLAAVEMQLRDILDAGNIILNSDAAKHGLDRSFEVSPPEMNELLRLALLYAEMLSVADLYAYRNAEIRIKRRSLVVATPAPETDVATIVASVRSGDHDHIRHTLLAPLEIDVETKCNSIPLDTGDSFFDYLKKVATTEAEAAARRFGVVRRNDLEIEICQFFELGSQITTPAGTFSVDQLNRVWAVLNVLALLGQQWNRRIADLHRNAEILTLPVPELQEAWLVWIVARETGLSRSTARKAIRQFSSLLATGRIDLFLKPLIKCGDTMCLPTPYIRGSRFERNLFTLIATETELDQKSKGYLPVKELEGVFKKAQFSVLTNFRVKVDHREFTDIDLVAFKEGLLFVAQCKIVIEPDTLYEGWKAEKKLKFAASQLDVCVAHLDAIRLALFARLGLPGQRETRVVPFIFTNTRQFTQRRFGGYPVVDIAYLRFLLGGAREGLIGLNAGEIKFGSGKSYIHGQYPTGDELSELIHQTIHKIDEQAVVQGHTLRTVGDLKIHIPMIRVKPDSQSRLVIT